MVPMATGMIAGILLVASRKESGQNLCHAKEKTGLSVPSDGGAHDFKRHPLMILFVLIIAAFALPSIVN